MKTINRTIIILAAFLMLAPVFAFAQGSSGAAAEPNVPGRAIGRSGDYRTRLSTSQTQAQLESAGTDTAPERPVQRAGESSAAFAARMRAWEAEVRRLTAASEIERLKRQLEISRPVSRPVAGTSAVSDNVTVIPAQKLGPENLLNINEDMNIMSRILLNKLNPQPRGTLGGWNLFADQWVYGQTLGLANNKFSSMYLQGYGALFLMTVDFPLSAPPETQEKPQEPNEGEVDQVWQQTRQQIYEPQVASTTSTGTRTGAATISRTRAAQPQTKYDAEKVDNLKTTLVTTLKHASNIRALKPDESVTLRVTGPEPSTKIVSIKTQEKQTLITYESNGVLYTASMANDPEYLKKITIPIAIVIRAKKSDIDAFAKGELSLDKFRDTVEVFSYPLLSGNGTDLY